MPPVQRPEILPYLVAIVAVIGIIVLTAMGDKVPDILNIIAGGAVIGGAAISSPRGPA
jgi:hypothetical protein